MMENVYVAQLCSYFGECGGCQLQDVPYEEQVVRKADALEELFLPFWKAPIPVQPSPVVWHYRNKVDPTFGVKFYPEGPPEDGAREPVLGFKRKGRWYWCIDIHECLIGPEGLAALLRAVRRWMHDHDLPPFDSRKGEGLLKTLLVREGKRTKERMVALITREGRFDPGPFVQVVQDVFPAASIWHGVSHRTSDVAIADEMTLLAGAETLHEELHIPAGDGTRILRFQLSPFSFFQTNTLAAERLYGVIRERVQARAPRVLYDLYAGIGTIALACADVVEQVHGVEEVFAATEDAELNAEENGVSNATFYTEKTKNFLLGRLTEGGLAPNAAAVVDPPRAGMHPKALKRLIALRPEHLLYVSCNPKILAREMPEFLKHYRLTDMEAVDLFPHTPHVEVLARLVPA